MLTHPWEPKGGRVRGPVGNLSGVAGTSAQLYGFLHCEIRRNFRQKACIWPAVEAPASGTGSWTLCPAYAGGCRAIRVQHGSGSGATQTARAWAAAWLHAISSEEGPIHGPSMLDHQPQFVFTVCSPERGVSNLPVCSLPANKPDG